MSWSAELAVCGAMLASESAIEAVTLREGDFQFPEVAELYSKIKKIYIEGKQVSLVSVKYSYPADEHDTVLPLMLDAADQCEHASKIGSYQRVVKDEAYMRRFQDWYHRLGDVKTISQVEEQMSKRPLPEVGGEMVGIEEITLPTKQDGVTTGFQSIDSLTYGAGFVSGQTTVVSAYHKKGKTAFLTQCAVAAARVTPVIYATFADLDPRRLMQRMLIQESGSRQVDGEFAEAALSDIQKLPIVFYDARKHGRTVEEFTSKVRSYTFKNEAGIVFADYGQKIRSQRFSGVEEATDVSAQLCDLADDLSVPVVVGSQITITEAGVITKGGRVWEEDAGTVIRLDRKRDSEDAVVDVAFNRHGPERKLDMKWNERRLIFEEDPTACMK